MDETHEENTTKKLETPSRHNIILDLCDAIESLKEDKVPPINGFTQPEIDAVERLTDEDLTTIHESAKSAEDGARHKRQLCEWEIRRRLNLAYLEARR